MMTTKKMFRPQVLFPAVILLLLVVALILAAATQPKGPMYKAEKTNTPATAMMSWADVDEEQFFRFMSAAVYAELQPDVSHYRFTAPDEEEFATTVTVYSADVSDVLAQPRIDSSISAGDTIPIHSISEIFSDPTIEGSSNRYILCLAEQRDDPNFVPNTSYDASYYDAYFKQFGYAIITPAVSIFRAEPYGDSARIKTSHLPEFLRGEGEYTTLEELKEFLAAGRAKYGMSGYSQTAE